MKLLLAAPHKLAYASIDIKDATIIIRDGTPVTPNEIAVKVGEGNVTYTENRNIEYRLDRSILDDVRETDEAPIDVSLDATWEFITASSGGTPTIEDALKRIGEASAWISTDSDTCRPYAVDLIIQNIPDCDGTIEKEVITLPDFRWDTIAHDLREATIAVTGRSNAVLASVVRLPQST